MAGVQVVCETNEVMASFRFARVCPSRGIPINNLEEGDELVSEVWCQCTTKATHRSTRVHGRGVHS